jgi:O-antigen/teichoic acid export membrane protein
VGIAQLLTLEAVLAGLVLVLAQAFMALGRPGFVTVTQFVGLAILLPGMLVLLPRFGLVGAAISLLVSTTTRLALLLFSYPIILGVPLPNLIPTRDDFESVRHGLIRS